jgi:hypothetical protein
MRAINTILTSAITTLPTSVITALPTRAITAGSGAGMRSNLLATTAGRAITTSAREMNSTVTSPIDTAFRPGISK